ncbi:hypothetical protein [Halobacillus litoralis]|uniref:hypothetical protein n=1 Tax=Halobacillus litoralis TaxID=45668 RepID=UPI001CFEDDA0|nr:hypothetical protein [Halobacillus litoralis]
MKKYKNYLLPLTLLGILLLAAGCTEVGNSSDESESQNQGEDNISTVLENVFDGPGEEQEALLASDSDVEDKGEKLDEYYKENFQPYMSESFFERFVNTNGAWTFLQPAYPEYALIVDEITLEEKDEEGHHSFTVKVSYTNNESGESETMTVEGTAYTNEDGKLTSIQYINDEELRTALN